MFETTFGQNDAQTVAVAAPGRVNLIGEHTDYNDGFVLPLALQKNTVLVGAKAAEGSTIVRLVSEMSPEDVAQFDLSKPDELKPGGEPEWANYVKGMVVMFQRQGYAVPGFDAAVSSDVPTGGGVSSSAALEMATGTLLEVFADITLEPSTKAKWGQSVEHEFVNLPCGIMDQLISAAGQEGHAMMLDCRSFEIKPVPLDDPSVKIVVANSMVKHSLSGSEYPERRAQCYAAAKALGVPHLRDATMKMLDALPEGTLDQKTYMRARHVITENDRVVRFAQALQERDYIKAGLLMNDSHTSQRDDYEVSVPEIDHLVRIAQSVEGVYGARLTGGGFGGCTVTLCQENAVPALFEAFKKEYEPTIGKEALVFDTEAGPGARVLKL
ncbi:Galactokinase [Porphyridium purpureum]|uniref:Galactokinase n=1 Tax=Porphyridium purpureum TaxID=35688 RepID=A0A5J4Z585_PORPP|nr:Galactokinase [Porphyridium purpureum]|eukprot:POR2506..scf295_1